MLTLSSFTRTLRPTIVCSLTALWGIGAWSQPAMAQQQSLPTARLLSVFPNGGKQGATVEVTPAGADLDDATGLLFSDPGITAVQKTTEPGLGQTGPQPVPGQFIVTIKPEVKPGVYECRAAGRYGLSNPRAFVVGKNAEVVEKEPNNILKDAQVVALESTISGRSERATDEDYYKFAAKKGQRIIIESWAYRLDSRMDTTLVLLSAAGQELARNRDVNRRDALLDVTAPADGEYIVKIYDFTYGGSADHFYRLSIGTGPYIDLIYPPAGLASSQGQYTVYGRNLPGGQPAKNVTVDGKPLDTLSVQIQLPGGPASQELATGTIVEPSELAVDAIEYRVDAPQGSSNPVLVGVTELPIVLEQEPNNDPAKAATVPVPCEYQGQFFPRGDQDWVSFQAKQGDTFWIEVISQRLGLTTDAFLLVQQVKKNDKGEEQVTDVQNVDDQQNSNIGGPAFDTTTTDPAVRFVAPAEGQYRVLVKDLYGSSRSDPRYVYRLAIRPAKPDFRLVAVPRYAPSTQDNNQQQPGLWSSNLRKGGSDLIDIVAFRRDGFDGEIQATVEGLPAGVTSSTVTIPPGQTTTTLVMTAAENAAEAVATCRVVGKAKIADAEVVRTARAGTMIWQGVQNPQIPPRSRMSRNLTVAVNAREAAPFALDVGQSPVIEISRAGTIKIPVKLARRGEFKGAVALNNLGLPREFQGKKINIDAGKQEATYEITVPNNAPLGSFTAYLVGTSQFQYARNPEAAKAATDRKTAIDKMAADLAKAAKDATDAKTAADKALADARAAEKTAGDAAKSAQTALEKDTANQDLLKAKETAEKAAQEAATKTKAATEALAAADKAATEAAAKAKEAADLQKNLAAAVTDLTNKAKPANINVGAPSPNVCIKVTPSPVAMTIAAPPGPLKKEAKLEVPLTIRRIAEFADDVPVKVTMPGNAKGLKAPDVTIAKGQNEVKLVVEASKDATPGTYKLSVQATPKLNGQNLPETQEVTIVVE